MKNVRFFDSSKGLELDKQTKEILEVKLQNIQEQFNGKLEVLVNSNNTLLAQIKRYRILSASNDEQLTLQDLVSKVITVSENADEVWKLINKECPGYFLKCIQKHFGINEN